MRFEKITTQQDALRNQVTIRLRPDSATEEAELMMLPRYEVQAHPMDVERTEAKGLEAVMDRYFRNPDEATSWVNPPIESDV